ncbi:MAG: TIGR04053 family radical SAM/SPASM domain-containing protein [Elusimicrobia bacterium]|nr:TIGR04053 family radical SAM/SPASM domain-containing protein [Elusimicrobiota bacterium]
MTTSPQHPAALPAPFDFSQAPLLVIWESTRSCALACDHCRADADTTQHPNELTTAEGKNLIDQVKAMGTPIMILSGGDPLNRKDLEELIRYGKSVGLRMGTIPAATPNLTRERLASLKEAGVDQIAFSLDGATAASHDAFRRTPGTFDTVLRAARQARELGIPIQINSCFGAWNWREFDALAALVSTLDIAFWEVFFLIPVGRGAKLGGLTPAQFEEGFAKLRRMTREKPFVVKLTEGQHFRRFVLQQEAAGGSGVAGRVEHAVARQASLRAGLRLPKRAVNAADGFMFVDHLGDICPSGFLPVRRGNIREDGLADIYRYDELFRGLRDHSRLKGKCGVCEYREVCGGSRARSWAVTGDAWASDESCAYEPQGLSLASSSSTGNL